MEDILTVDSLNEKLNKLSKAGYGSMKIKCIDCYLHDDEITYDYGCKGGELIFHGYLFNQPIAEKISTLREDIKLACNKFYGF